MSLPEGGDVTSRTPGSVPTHEQARGQLGWPKPYPTDARPSLTSDSSPPPRLGGNSALSRQIAFSARVRVGASPSAIRWPAPTGACNLQYPFLKDDRSRLVSLRASHAPLGPGTPASTLGCPLRRARPTNSEPIRPRPATEPCLCPFVANPVIGPISGPTRAIRLDRFVPASRRRSWDFPAKRSFHPPPSAFRRRDTAFTGPVAYISLLAVPEHDALRDPPRIEGFCSSKTTREQFRGLLASSPNEQRSYRARTP